MLSMCELAVPRRHPTWAHVDVSRGARARGPAAMRLNPRVTSQLKLRITCCQDALLSALRAVQPAARMLKGGVHVNLAMA